MTPQEKKREQHLLKRYNLTLAEYNEMAAGGCMICGRPGVTRSLSVDHDHRVERAKVEAVKSAGVWQAWAPGYYIQPQYAAKRAEAVHYVRRLLLRASVRGVLCFHHNRGLQMFNDDPELLRAAATYLERFQNNVGKVC